MRSIRRQIEKWILDPIRLVVGLFGPRMGRKEAVNRLISNSDLDKGMWSKPVRVYVRVGWRSTRSTVVRDAKAASLFTSYLACHNKSSGDELFIEVDPRVFEEHAAQRLSIFERVLAWNSVYSNWELQEVPASEVMPHSHPGTRTFLGKARKLSMYDYLCLAVCVCRECCVTVRVSSRDAPDWRTVSEFHELQVARLMGDPR